MDKPKITYTEKARKEKQIVVNALSQKEPCDASTALAAPDLHRPTSQPPKPKLLSLSLPNSANSSPSTLMKKKLKHKSIESPCQAITLKHQYDQLQEMQLRRSKSCGEERASCAPSDEFDLWWIKPIKVDHQDPLKDLECDNMHRGSFSKTEAIRESLVISKDVKTCQDEGFKCSALCMYLPGFGKAKAVKTRKEGGEMSRTVSLEKFECGSWASSALLHEIEGDPMSSLYFDLPLEFIKSSANEVHSPVTSAFVFEKDFKGVPKTGSGSSARSPHHAPISTSSSTSKPPLRNVREDFTAFLEAQSA